MAVDAVVAGGGPAGAAAALRLAAAGRAVGLVDSPAVSAGAKIGEALPPAARPLLRSLGVWERFCDEGHLACHGNDSAWGSPDLAATDFVFDPDGHGWHLDRSRFDAFLRAQAGVAGADLRPATVRHHARSSAGGWEVTLDDGTALRARWLIDATGRRTTIARRQGGRRRTLDRTVAVVARLGARPRSSATPRDRDSRTLIEATPDGWWYTALVPGDEQAVAYVSDRDLLPSSVRTAAGFSALLEATRHVGPRLARYALTTEPLQVAAGGARSDPPAGDGWVAVGDAAVAFDPLSSQGILTALYTGMVAADAVQAELDGGAGAVDDYVARVGVITGAYQRNLARSYALERRWASRPFWRRRAVVAPSAPG